MRFEDLEVISELRKAKTGKADAKVIAWAERVPIPSLFLSVITLLELETGVLVYLRFHYLACDLSRLPATQYLNSANLVARLNLVKMAYAPEQRLKVYARAQDGLAGLESSWDRRLKYAAFIDGYAQLSETEWAQYRREYLADSDQREVIMGMLSYSRKEGLQQGLQQML